MTLQSLIQQLIGGLATGALYGLVATAYNFPFAAAKAINFATGEFFMLGAFLALSLTKVGVPLIGSITLSALGAGILMLLLERAVVRKAYGHPELTILIITLAFSTCLRSGAQLIWGTIPEAFPSYLPERPFKVGGILVSRLNLVLLVVGVLIMLAIQKLLVSTSIGTRMRAVAQNREVASLNGVDVSAYVSGAWASGAVIAALAGILMAPMYFVTTDMGVIIALKGFAAATVGGLGKSFGGLVGGFIVGVSESLGAGLLSSTYKDAIAFAVMIIFLILRPSGVFGKTIEKL